MSDHVDVVEFKRRQDTTQLVFTKSKQRNVGLRSGWLKNTPPRPDKMQFLDNRARCLHRNFLICTEEILLQF